MGIYTTSNCRGEWKLPLNNGGFPEEDMRGTSVNFFHVIKTVEWPEASCVILVFAFDIGIKKYTHQTRFDRKSLYCKGG